MRLKKDQRLGWWLCDETKTLPYLDDRKVRLGVRLKMKTRVARGLHLFTLTDDQLDLPVACRQGMHASDKISQALTYHNGPYLCRVLVEGDIDVRDNKFAGRYRTVLWWKKVPDSFGSWSPVRQNQWARDNGAPHMPKTKRRKVAKGKR